MDKHCERLAALDTRFEFRFLARSKRIFPLAGMPPCILCGGKKKRSNLTHEGQGMHKCQPSLPFRPPILFVLLAGVKPHQI
jgi:hypothetical protein